MNVLGRLLREYNLISGAVVATLAFASLMEVLVLSQEQWAGLLGLIAAWMLVLRFIVTPTADPVLKPGTVVNASSDEWPTSVIPEEPE